jgi:endonuclease III-like uncharacterized protein
MQSVEQLPASRKLFIAHDEQLVADQYALQLEGHVWHCMPLEYSLLWHDCTRSVPSDVRTYPAQHDEFVKA